MRWNQSVSVEVKVPHLGEDDVLFAVDFGPSADGKDASSDPKRRLPQSACTPVEQLTQQQLLGCVSQIADIGMDDLSVRYSVNAGFLQTQIKYCQRCSKFVSSVNHQLPFIGERLRQPLQRLIHRMGQMLQFARKFLARDGARTLAGAVLHKPSSLLHGLALACTGLRASNASIGE